MTRSCSRPQNDTVNSHCACASFAMVSQSSVSVLGATLAYRAREAKFLGTQLTSECYFDEIAGPTTINHHLHKVKHCTTLDVVSQQGSSHVAMSWPTAFEYDDSSFASTMSATEWFEFDAQALPRDALFDSLCQRHVYDRC
jgi:hypothetical protein